MNRRVYTEDEIAKEYDLASQEEMEFEKVKWGSQDSMNNRFKWAIDNLSFQFVKSWLDIGSGTGAFQSMVLKKYSSINIVGIDLSQKLIEFSRKRIDCKNVDYLCVDFLSFSIEQKFDLITCIGVLQKTNMCLSDFFFKTGQLLSDEGKLFIDTKNLEWDQFKKKNLQPENTHEWFTVEELHKSALSNGLALEARYGFLPKEGKVVTTEQSHTIFMIFSKRKEKDDY